MLLESVLAEISLDILDDLHPQMQLHVITPAVVVAAAAFHDYNNTHNVVFEMCSPSESSSELHQEKEERENGSRRRELMKHLSDDEEKSNIIVCDGFVQRRNINGYDADNDEDSNEEWSPVSTLELPESPRSSSVIAEANSPARFSLSLDDSHYTMPSDFARSACTTLFRGIFPCKCICLPLLRHKYRKKKQSEWATGYKGCEDESMSSTSSDGLNMILKGSQPDRPTCALKKKSTRLM